MRRVYLAGPDVFLPDATGHAAAKVAICARYGLEGLAPGDGGLDLAGMADGAAWRTIYRSCLGMMEACDLVIANLTPFRGASADSGTLVELGWFLGRGRPAFGYSNCAAGFAERSRRQVAAVADPVAGLSVEGFGLPDNLMIPGALLQAGGREMVLPADGRDREFASLEVFEACVAVAARSGGGAR